MHHIIHYHRGPSRILWFILGGIAATTLMGFCRSKRAQWERGCLKHSWGRTPDMIAEEQERAERVRQIKDRASETMLDLTEVTLDNALAAVHAMKAKIAAERVRRTQLRDVGVQMEGRNTEHLV